MNIRLRRIYKAILAIFVILIMLCGCGRNAYGLNKVTIRDNEQTYIEFEEALQGDLDADLHLVLRADGLREIGYHADHDEMEVEALNYQVGDLVHKGEVLVTFKADELEKRILAIDKKINDDLVLLENIAKMKALYPHSDYSLQEKKLLNDLEVRRVEKEESSAWLTGYSVVAEDNGVVKNVSSVWDTTKVGPNDTLITVVYSSGVFTGSTSDNYDFRVGESYVVDVGLAKRNIILQDIVDEGVNDEGNMVRKLTFVLEDVESVPVADSEIQLNIERDMLRNVVYIPKSAVVIIDGKSFVYVVSDEGIPILRQVVTGASVDSMVVINSGLVKGEKVVTEL